MKYFLDTEFHERIEKPIKWFPTIGNFNKPIWKIELISIGIVAEDGRTFYRVNREFNVDVAWENEWLRENVLAPIFKEFIANENYAKYHFPGILKFNIKNFKTYLKWKGTGLKLLADNIINFINPDCVLMVRAGLAHMNAIKPHNLNNEGWAQPEFYAYYADYDWVVFCSQLYGSMINLPKGFPMYCKDLKQSLDELVDTEVLGNLVTKDMKPVTFDSVLNTIKKHPNYPKQENEHNALADAKWNKKLYEFIKSL